MPESFDRRQVFWAATLAGGAMGAPLQRAKAAPISADTFTIQVKDINLSVVDLTHTLTDAFAGNPLRSRLVFDPIIGSGLAAGMNLNRALLVEHTGTHIDAPLHFSNTGASLGQITLRDLVVPLAVMDLRKRAKNDPDVGLQPSDIMAWERQHGRLPANCCVAINTGYDASMQLQQMRTSVAPSHQSPGFSPEVAEMLIEQRSVRGVAVDAMSIDQGSNGPRYPVHQRWLRSGRWGIEGLTNLDAVPASGATLIIGVAPVDHATGFPIRALALF